MAHIFVSWSGSLSHAVANRLNDWIPKVLQKSTTFLSSEKIQKGSRWLTELGKELESATFGVICVTPDNYQAPWLTFEAGALSKSVENGRVAPFLFGLEPAALKGPLNQFQATTFTRSDVLDLVKAINAASGTDTIETRILEASFEKFWPDLADSLNQLREEHAPAPPPRRDTDDIMDELLDLSRAQSRLLSSPDQMVPPEFIVKAVVRALAIHDSDRATESPRIDPVTAVAAGKYTISGIINCNIESSYDDSSVDAFLEHRSRRDVRARRIVLLRAAGEPLSLIKALDGLIAQHPNYAVRVGRSVGADQMGAWAFSVIDHRFVVVRAPGGEAFAMANERAAHVLGAYFETLWSSLPTSSDYLRTAGGQALSEG